MIQSDDAYYSNNVHFQAIIDLGDAVIPFVIETLKEHDEYSHFMVNALQKITNYRFNQQEIAAAELLFGHPLGNQIFAYLWIGWWRKKSQTITNKV